MTNYERYKEFLSLGYGVRNETGLPESCSCMDCDVCRFYPMSKNACTSCEKLFVKWLNEEVQWEDVKTGTLIMVEENGEEHLKCFAWANGSAIYYSDNQHPCKSECGWTTANKVRIANESEK